MDNVLNSCVLMGAVFFMVCSVKIPSELSLDLNWMIIESETCAFGSENAGRELFENKVIVKATH